MEKLEEVLDQYDISRRRVFRGRKMMMCEEEQGKIYGVAAVEVSANRLKKEFLMKEYLQNHQFRYVDQLVLNKNGEFLTKDRYHTTFLLKQYYVGRECDVNNLKEVQEGAANLAAFHKASVGVGEWLYEQEMADWQEQKEKLLSSLQDEECEKDKIDNAMLRTLEKEPVRYYEGEKNAYKVLEELFHKRNAELKRISTFTKKPGRKGEFVDAYNSCTPRFLKQAKQATKLLEDKMKNEHTLPLYYGLCHGNYQHHNILRLNNGWATVGMENFHFGIQLEDLYDFLRKVLEKNEYRSSYANAVLSGYDKILPLSSGALTYLCIMLNYPEKFWKIANRYYNTKKTWVPPKTVEKLNKIVEQDEKKQRFLADYMNPPAS